MNKDTQTLFTVLIIIWFFAFQVFFLLNTLQQKAKLECLIEKRCIYDQSR